MIDNFHEENNEIEENLEVSQHDLEKDDGHLKAKTKKQEEYEAKEEKRKREAMLATAKSSEAINSDSLKKQKYERKELSKQEGADLEHLKEQEREPELHLEERDRNEHHYTQQIKSPIRIQGIDAETQQLMDASLKAHKNTSVGIEDAGKPGDLRSPSITPDARPNIEKGGPDRFR